MCTTGVVDIGTAGLGETSQLHLVIGTIIDCLNLKVNMKEKLYLYVATGVTLGCENLHAFSKKFETALLECVGACGKIIHKKTCSRKSRGTVPLNVSRY